MAAMRVMAKVFKGTGSSLAILVGAVLLGFGVPVFWLWVASQIYGQTGAVNGGVAAFIFFAILLSYCFALLVASWVRARLGHGAAEAQQIKRAVWNRSMRDSQYKPGDHRADFVERLFVATTIVVGIGFLIWFAFFAGAPFPST
jgi:multisubunit Na+/H+ antiporter MnhC subunit